MRCNNCNVDLGENYTICPLCNNRAVDEPAKIKGFKTAEYPKTFKPVSYKHFSNVKQTISIDKLKAIFNI